MDRFYKMVEASNKRFPEGVNPFQMATRLLEEAGEVAAEINHWEGSGLKRQKHGEPRKEDIANELRQTIVELFKIAAYYSVEKELEESINLSLQRSRDEGLMVEEAAMSDIVYRRLEWNDVDQFIELRKHQLQEEGAEAFIDLTPPLADYYKRHLEDGTFVSWLALDGGEIVATSGMSFVEKPPTYGIPTGKIGILSSMYTLAAYRRRGIAKKLLGLVVGEARDYGCGAVQITASDMGVLLYQDFGFEKNGNFLQYKIK